MAKKTIGFLFLFGFIGLFVGYGVNGRKSNGEYFSPSDIFVQRDGVVGWGINKYYGLEEKRNSILMFGLVGSILGIIIGVLSSLDKQKTPEVKESRKNTFADFQKHGTTLKDSKLNEPISSGQNYISNINKTEKELDPEKIKELKEKGILEDYMKLKLIEGLSNSNFAPAQIAAFQMLNKEESIKKIIESKNDGTILKKMKVTVSLINMESEKIYPIEKDVVTIGRSDDCDIVLKDDYASRKHLQLVINNNEVIAINISASNGISVNKNNEILPGQRCKLNSDDVIEVGYTRLKLIKRT